MLKYSNSSSKPLVEIESLTKSFHKLKAVKDLSFNIHKGEVFALVGESGSGKTTVGKLILRLLEPDFGNVRFDGQDLFALSNKEMKRLKRRMQMIFQDPYGSLNPKMTIEEIIAEPFQIHHLAKGKKLKEEVMDLLHLVGLQTEHAYRFPHEFSGGQRQRIGIARAIALKPDFIVCDEPISSLDVSIQSQILKLLMEIHKTRSMSYLFITHDLSVVKHFAHRVAVMYHGNIIELASSKDLYQSPLHPYTQHLLSIIPTADPIESRKRLQNKNSYPINVPDRNFTGCPFFQSCPMAKQICQKIPPPLKEVHPGHYVACHLLAESRIN